jgi:hypothetical protein
MCFRPQVSPAPSPEDGNRYNFRNVVFFCVFRIPDDGQSPKPTSPECLIPTSGPLKSTLKNVLLCCSYDVFQISQAIRGNFCVAEPEVLCLES